MSYTLKEGEVAVVLRPHYDDNDEWDGMSTEENVSYNSSSKPSGQLNPINDMELAGRLR